MTVPSMNDSLSPFERAAAERHALGITLASLPASGAPSGQPRKTMPDCGPLRIMPEAVLEPPEFAVCPFMRKIRMFRYFWRVP
jgi:hypothetical protein